MTVDIRRRGAFGERGGRADPVEGSLAASGSDTAWRTLGLAALLGLVAGATLFATPAHGRREARRPSGRRR